MSNNSPIVIKKYHEDLGNTKEDFQTYVNNYLESDVVQKNVVPEAKGVALTTAQLDPEWIFTIPGIDPLFEWVKKEILDASFIIRGKQYKSLSFRRAGVNKMYKGSSGAGHNHKFNGIVAIFYLNAPFGSAKLIGKDMEFFTKTGDLVMHDGDFDHSVSTHNLDEPRVVMVFEVLLIE